MNINTMIREISDIAVAEGLVEPSWPSTLRVKLRKRAGRSFGGKKDGTPGSISRRPRPGTTRQAR